MRKFLCVLLALLMLSGCAALEENFSSLPTPTDSAAASPAASAALSPSLTVSPLPTVSATSLPTPSPAPAIELIDTAKLPGVETGDWYEWDIAGNHPANGILYYNEAQDSLFRIEYGSTACLLVSSKLDGTDRQVIDSDANIGIYSLNVYNSWLYYLKGDGVWKSRADGSCKSLIIQYAPDEYYSDSMFVYDGRIYLIRDCQECIETYDLNGGKRRKIDVPDLTLNNFFFENGILYYGAITPEDEGGDCWSVYRYDLSSRSYSELEHDGWGPILARNGTAYYLEDGMMYNDGSGSQKLISSDDEYWNYNYSIYRNLLLYFKSGDEYGSYDGGTLYAYDLNTERQTALFDFGEMYWYSLQVMQNSVFLYSGFIDDPVYRITFENDQAYLWRLNNLS